MTNSKGACRFSGLRLSGGAAPTRFGLVESAPRGYTCGIDDKVGLEGETWRERYEAKIDLIDRVVAFVCRRNGMQPDEAEEFRSEVHLKLIESDYSMLRQFDGRSSFRTFVSVVIQRLALDFRNERWGKWRPSEAARRMGDEAITLETLIIRQGHSFAEAVEIMRTNHGSTTSRDDLYAMTLAFPARWGRSSMTLVELDESVRSSDRTPEERAIDEEIVECERVVAEAISDEMSRATPADRALLRLVHFEGRKLSTVARALQLDQQKLYRRVHQLQRQLRTALEGRGIDWKRMAPAFENRLPGRRLDLEKIFDGSPSMEDDAALQEIRRRETAG